jgi:hypothetical protein
MAYKIEVRALATIEIIEAYDWYELQRAGLGDEFLLVKSYRKASLYFELQQIEIQLVV